MKTVWRLRRSKVILTLVLAGLTGLFGSVYVALQFDTNLLLTALVGTPGLALVALMLSVSLMGPATDRRTDVPGSGADDSSGAGPSQRGRINPTSGYPMMRGRVDSGGYTFGSGPRDD